MTLLFCFDSEPWQAMEDVYRHSLTEWEEAAWSATFIVMGILVVAINTLTLLTFIKTPALRARRHVMIINLTVADLLFGVAGLPSSVLFLLKPSYFSFSLWQILNRFTKLVSLYTIAVIAIERMHAIVFPIHHKVLRNSVYKIALVFIWSIAAASTVVMAIGNLGFVVVSAGLLLTIAVAVLAIIISCYITIWILLRRRNRRLHRISANQDKALAVTLLFVAGGFVITWFPPTIYLSINRVCKTCLKLSKTMIGLTLLLVLVSQSLINPIIYCFRISRFKVSLKALVKKITFWEMYTLSGHEGKRQATVHPEITIPPLDS